MWEPKRSATMRTNKMSMMHYNMIAAMYRELFKAHAFDVCDPEGNTCYVVPVSSLLKASCATMKADNPRFVDSLFVDGCLKGE